MKKSDVAVVIPTIRNLDFLASWKNEFADSIGIIIEDHPKRQIISPRKYFKKVYHFTWQDIDREFKDNNWIFSRRNAGIRSYGFYKAYLFGYKVILTLDDDCYPAESDFLEKHLANLEFKAPQSWFPTYPHPTYMYTRGYPYSVRAKTEVVISHGLWSGALDLDAKTEVKLPKLLNEAPYPPLRQFIPRDYFFPMCSMNLAFKREITPLMYFPLMGYDPRGRYWGFDRYDDIWAGLFAKKVCDHLNLTIVNGSPFVEHRKASVPIKNLKRERAGLKVNEDLWTKVAQIKLIDKTPTTCYQELTQKIDLPAQPYFRKLKKAMQIWSDLFQERENPGLSAHG